MRSLEVCYSPELIHLHELKGKIVVVVDILRATSCMTAGLASGVKSIIPVSTLEEAEHYQQRGYITAGERSGEKIPHFDLGNSPFGFMNPQFREETIVMTTTNGTHTIEKSRAAKQVVIGSFLNLSALANYLIHREEDIIIHCAGWKGKFNLEDTLFAGALACKLLEDVKIDCDATLAAMNLYELAKVDLFTYMKNSSHFRRLGRLNVIEDIKYCLKSDVFDVIPVLQGKELLILQEVEETLYE